MEAAVRQVDADYVPPTATSLARVIQTHPPHKAAPSLRHVRAAAAEPEPVRAGTPPSDGPGATSVSESAGRSQRPPVAALAHNEFRVKSRPAPAAAHHTTQIHIRRQGARPAVAAGGACAVRVAGVTAAGRHCDGGRRARGQLAVWAQRRRRVRACDACCWTDGRRGWFPVGYLLSKNPDEDAASLAAVFACKLRRAD